MSLTDELAKLAELHDQGVLNGVEFRQAKEKLLAEQHSERDQQASSAAQNADAPEPQRYNQRSTMADSDVNDLAMWIHISQFSSIIVPFAGLVVPVVLWQLNKDRSPMIDEHGKIVVNWLLSHLIYTGVSVILVYILIGIPLLLMFIVMGVLFGIMGAVKARRGVLWVYPLSIPFFRLSPQKGTYSRRSDRSDPHRRPSDRPHRRLN